MIHTAYLGPALNIKIRRKIITSSVRFLSKYKKDFDAIAVRGNSGVIIGSILSARLNKHLWLIRKDNESSHSHLALEGFIYKRKKNRYLILDDFVYCGNTFKHIIGVVNKEVNNNKLFGIFLYNNQDNFDLREEYFQLHIEYIKVSDNTLCFKKPI